jgi:hypothetical protein
MFFSGMGMGYSPNWAKPRQQHPEPYRSRYPSPLRLGQRLQRRTGLDLSPIHLHQLLPAGADPAPVAHQPDRAEQVALHHQRVKAPDTLLRVDPVQHEVMLDRRSQLVRHRAPCRQLAARLSSAACGPPGGRTSSSAASDPRPELVDHQGGRRRQWWSRACPQPIAWQNASIELMAWALLNCWFMGFSSEGAARRPQGFAQPSQTSAELLLCTAQFLLSFVIDLGEAMPDGCAGGR